MQLMWLPGNVDVKVFNEEDLLICDRIQVALATVENDEFMLGSRTMCAGFMQRASTARVGGAPRS